MRAERRRIWQCARARTAVDRRLWDVERAIGLAASAASFVNADNHCLLSRKIVSLPPPKALERLEPASENGAVGRRAT